MLEVDKAKKASLYLHKIPHNVPSQELKGVITGDFKVEVKVIAIVNPNMLNLFSSHVESEDHVLFFVQPPKKVGGYYSAEAVFSSQEEANQAFDNVEGDIVKVLGIIFLTVQDLYLSLENLVDMFLPFLFLSGYDGFVTENG